MDEVRFYNNGSLIGTEDRPVSGNVYERTWTINVASGSVKLKAVAVDKAGNETEKTLVIQVKGPVEVDESGDSDAVALAREERTKARDIIVEFTAKGIPVPAELNSAWSAANALLSEAMDLSESNREESDKKAVEAKDAYSNILANFSGPLQIFSADFSFGNEGLEEKVNALLADSEKAGESIALLADANAKRTIKAFTAGDGNGVFLVVEISVRNTGETTSLQIVEFIPKEFAATSDLIASIIPFEELLADPVIKFRLESIEPGETATISYYLKEPVSQEAFDEMNASSFEEFNKPPLLFGAETVVGSGLVDGSSENQAAFFSLGEIAPWVGLIVVLLVVAVGVYFVLSKREPGEPESLSPLDSAVRRSHGPEKRSFLGGFDSKQDEKKPGKWGFKGE